MNQTLVRLLMQHVLMEKSEALFARYPDMTSFGWHQCTERWKDGRDVTFEESLEKPDISGSLGELIYHDDDGRQQAVAALLKSIPKEQLLRAFGDGVDVAVYSDLTIELNDANRSLVYEL